MKFTEWKNSIIKAKGVNYDGMYGKQCVDLVNDYAEKVLGIKGCFYGLTYAYEIYAKYQSLVKINTNFSRINVNNHGEYPKIGDVIVWDKAKNGYAGHTAVCISGNKDGFTVFEQNYDGKGGIREYTYSGYKNVLGWLRPKNQSNLPHEVKKVLYGNAKMKSAQNVYADSDLELKVGSVSKNERVKYLGTGENHPIIVYITSKGYKCGFVATGSVIRD